MGIPERVAEPLVARARILGRLQLALGKGLLRSNDMQVLDDFAIHNRNTFTLCLRLGKGVDLAARKFNL